MKEITIKNIDELPKLATQLLTLSEGRKIFLFNAPMGAGKTTLIKELCKGLGVAEHVTSPTFSIVNEYSGADAPIFHFDFYRLKNEQEAYDLGYEEYFYSGNYCFVEWPQKIKSLLPLDAFIINIEINDDQSRLIQINI